MSSAAGIGAGKAEKKASDKSPVKEKKKQSPSKADKEQAAGSAGDGHDEQEQS
jgi:hypothetical protein